MDAKTVNDAFNHAWHKYEVFKEEVDEFCEENNLSGILKVEMSGPHLQIKHGLSPKFWTKELHDKLCEKFGVYLTFFEIEHLKTNKTKPPIIVFRWSYTPEFYHENDILEYDDAISICDEVSI